MQAITLNESKEKAPVNKAPAKEKAALVVPDDLIVFLENHPKAKETWEKFSYSA